MKDNKNKKSTLHITIGTFAALFGLASGIFYQYHEGVESYRPDDVSNGFGLYSTMLSALLWIAFLIVVPVQHFRNKNNKK